MTDIVERLRRLAEEHYEMLDDVHLPMNDAANEIELLREWNREIALNAREFASENERLRAALIPFACRCSRKGEGAGGTCLAPGGICSWWNARAALEERL